MRFVHLQEYINTHTHIYKINAFQKGKEAEKIIYSVHSRMSHRCKISNIPLSLLQLMHISVSAEEKEQAQITRRLIREQRNTENETIAKIN